MAVLGKGYRVFFLLGAAFAALVVPLWLAVWAGDVAPAGPLAGLVWHAHEMVHGFTVAIMAGFLLTAVSNWTGRETATGAALGSLALLWLAGRAALLLVPGWPASAIDLAFLPALALTIARPLFLTRNRRNAAFPVLLLLLWGTSLAAHLDALGVLPGWAVPANRAAVHLVAVVVLVISGRIVPLFTRNATGAEVRNVPALDATAVGATVALAAMQLVAVPGPVEAGVAGVAALAVVGRTTRWGLRWTWRDPLLWVLHVGHAWVAVGFALEAAAALGVVPRTTALHALTVGSIGMLTLGMMARVALGHSGRALVAPKPVAVGFGALFVAAVVRVVGPWVMPAETPTWLWTAGLLWAAAFGVYLAVYTPILVTPRPDGRPG